MNCRSCGRPLGRDEVWITLPGGDRAVCSRECWDAVPANEKPPATTDRFPANNPPDTETLVCIGGHANGRRVLVNKAAMDVIILEHERVAVVFGAGMPAMAGQITRRLYVKQPWRGGLSPDVRFVLAPEGQSGDETLRLMIEGYGKPIV